MRIQLSDEAWKTVRQLDVLPHYHLVDGEYSVSPKLSSLCVQDMEHIHGQETMNAEPELYVVEPRQRMRNAILSSMNSLEEVVTIRGRFTVSF